MGLLNIQDAIEGLVSEVDLSNGARCSVLIEQTDFLAKVFDSSSMTVMRENPLLADAVGMFPVCWVEEGTYRSVLETIRGKPLATVASVRVSDQSVRGFERGFSCVHDLLDDRLLSYEAKSGKWTVSEGATLRVMDGDGVYKVAAPGAVDHHIETKGGLKLLVLRNPRGFDVRQFGAVGYAAADDAPAIQAAINAATNSGGGRVYFPVGVYRCASSIQVFHSPQNPCFPNGDFDSGRIVLEGDGPMTRRDYNTDDFPGSVLSFDPGFRLELSTTASGNEQRGWRIRLADLSVIGAAGSLVYHPYAASFMTIEHLLVGNDGAVAGEATVYISRVWIGRVSDVEIIGDKSLTQKVGVGLHVDPSEMAGGSNSISNVTAGYFDTAIMIGRDHDPALDSFSANSRANVFSNVQGHWANTGIHLKDGCASSSFMGCWAEHCLSAAMRIDNSASNIEIVSSNFSTAPETVGDRGLIMIGNSTGADGVDRASGVSLRNNVFFCKAGVAGVFVMDAARDVLIERNVFFNAGGAAVGVEGGVGGEISLVGNEYDHQNAASEIIPARRVCSIAGDEQNPAYTDMAYLVRVLDFRPVAFTFDIDASSWRFPPAELIVNTLNGSLSITLPDLQNGSGRMART